MLDVVYVLAYGQNEPRSRGQTRPPLYESFPAFCLRSPPLCRRRLQAWSETAYTTRQLADNGAQSTVEELLALGPSSSTEAPLKKRLLITQPRDNMFCVIFLYHFRPTCAEMAFLKCTPRLQEPRGQVPYVIFCSSSYSCAGGSIQVALSCGA